MYLTTISFPCLSIAHFHPISLITSIPIPFPLLNPLTTDSHYILGLLFSIPRFSSQTGTPAQINK